MKKIIAFAVLAMFAFAAVPSLAAANAGVMPGKMGKAPRKHVSVNRMKRGSSAKHKVVPPPMKP